jgi:hypothetical protein
MTIVEEKGMTGTETGLISRKEKLPFGLGLSLEANVAQR